MAQCPPTRAQTYVALISDEAANRAVVEGLSERESLRASRSAARSLLPAATETKIFLSANALAIRRFLSQRGGHRG
ncbi:FAD-dependent thymidylate synthase [Mycolicibacterium sp. Dal123E01]|uniref:FAD-dependent thymidylate synthase n=1 Tax=Mycolicibacterium sp. Dal123E01 TaxID=3457578 RepID=UPI00403E5E7A